MKTVIVIAGAAVVLSGCNVSLPNFGPWPIATATEYGGNTLRTPYFAPGVWASPNALPSCRWEVRKADGTLVTFGTRGVATLPVSTATVRYTFSSKDCGVWNFVNPGQGR